MRRARGFAASSTTTARVARASELCASAPAESRGGLHRCRQVLQRRLGWRQSQPRGQLQPSRRGAQIGAVASLEPGLPRQRVRRSGTDMRPARGRCLVRLAARNSVLEPRARSSAAISTWRAPSRSSRGVRRSSELEFGRRCRCKQMPAEGNARRRCGAIACCHLDQAGAAALPLAPLTRKLGSPRFACRDGFGGEIQHAAQRRRTAGSSVLQLPWFAFRIYVPPFALYGCTRSR